MSRLVRKPVSFLGLAVFVAVPLWWYFRPFLAAAQEAGAPGAPQAVVITSVQRHVALKRAGLDAKTLAACGVSATAASALAQSGAQHIAAHPTALASVDAAYAAARREVDRLLRRVQSGLASAAEIAALATQKTALANAEAARTAALDAIFQAVTSGLTAPQRALLSTVRGNAAQDDLPTPYLAVNRSKTEWAQLRDDLANERISQREGVAPNPEGQTRLAIVRANATVAAANSATSANLAGITSALNTALGPPSNQ